jgi:pyroglutamyl-peptidase
VKHKTHKIIVAAFEPFGGKKRNRARDAVRFLRGEEADGIPIDVAELPVAYGKIPDAIKKLVAREPSVLILVGESADARTLLVERLAVNVAHATINDNAGMRPIDEELVRGGELARKVAFDPRNAANAAIAAGVACDVSSHAGTFLCNAALYHALGLAQKHGGRPRVVLVHVPARLPWARDKRAARGLWAIAKNLASDLS